MGSTYPYVLRPKGSIPMGLLEDLVVKEYVVSPPNMCGVKVGCHSLFELVALALEYNRSHDAEVKVVAHAEYLNIGSITFFKETLYTDIWNELVNEKHTGHGLNPEKKCCLWVIEKLFSL